MLISLKMESEFLNLININTMLFFCGPLTETKLCGKFPLRIVHLLYMLTAVLHICEPMFSTGMEGLWERAFSSNEKIVWGKKESPGRWVDGLRGGSGRPFSVST